MSDDKDLDRSHPGFGDHHHIRAKGGTPIDPNHRADTKVKDLVWDLLNGKQAPEAALPPGQIEVSVPFDYVNAIGFYALQELRRKGCGAAFSVKVDPDKPVVEIAWSRPGGLATASGNGYAGKTNCLAAFMAGLAPEHVGATAVELFLERLDRTIQQERSTTAAPTN
jgi:hypothetical protein